MGRPIVCVAGIPCIEADIPADVVSLVDAVYALHRFASSLPLVPMNRRELAHHRRRFKRDPKRRAETTRVSPLALDAHGMAAEICKHLRDLPYTATPLAIGWAAKDKEEPMPE